MSYCRSCLVPHRVSPGLSRELFRRRHSSVAWRPAGVASAQARGRARGPALGHVRLSALGSVGRVRVFTPAGELGISIAQPGPNLEQVAGQCHGDSGDRDPPGQAGPAWPTPTTGPPTAARTARAALASGLS